MNGTIESAETIASHAIFFLALSTLQLGFYQRWSIGDVAEREVQRDNASKPEAVTAEQITECKSCFMFPDAFLIMQNNCALSI